jgi:hypothetical protein
VRKVTTNATHACAHCWCSPVIRWRGIGRVLCLDCHPHVALQKEKKSKNDAVDTGPKRGARRPTVFFLGLQPILCLGAHAPRHACTRADTAPAAPPPPPPPLRHAAPTAYNLFVQAYYAKNPMKGVTFQERSVKVSEAWAKADKTQWKEMALQEKLRLENSRQTTGGAPPSGK